MLYILFKLCSVAFKLIFLLSILSRLNSSQQVIFFFGIDNFSHEVNKHILHTSLFKPKLPRKKATKTKLKLNFSASYIMYASICAILECMFPESYIWIKPAKVTINLPLCLSSWRRWSIAPVADTLWIVLDLSRVYWW